MNAKLAPTASRQPLLDETLPDVQLPEHRGITRSSLRPRPMPAPARRPAPVAGLASVRTAPRPMPRPVPRTSEVQVSPARVAPPVVTGLVATSPVVTRPVVTRALVEPLPPAHTEARASSPPTAPPWSPPWPVPAAHHPEDPPVAEAAARFLPWYWQLWLSLGLREPA